MAHVPKTRMRIARPPSKPLMLLVVKNVQNVEKWFFVVPAVNTSLVTPDASTSGAFFAELVEETA